MYNLDMNDADMISALTGIANRGIVPHLVGSVAIQGTGADVDYAIQVPDAHHDEIINLLTSLGFETRNHGYASVQDDDDQFLSFRKGDVNILFCMNEKSLLRFTRGRDFCILLKELGIPMEDKRVRVAIHGMVSNGSMDQVLKDLRRLR